MTEISKERQQRTGWAIVVVGLVVVPALMIVFDFDPQVIDDLLLGR